MSEAESLGVTVTWGPLPDGMRGTYQHRTATITLRAGMSDALAVPTLMHELAHAERGDDGHQGPRVERHIDVDVARALVSLEDLRRAERVVGPHLGALAVELGVPRWIIEVRLADVRVAA